MLVIAGGFAGGQAEYTRIPHGEANVIKVPDNVPDEEALYVSDILVTSYNQVEYTGVKEGDIVGIWGAGAIGKSIPSRTRSRRMGNLFAVVLRNYGRQVVRAAGSVAPDHRRQR